MGFTAFVWMVLLLVGLGVVRSAIATRLGGFTLDEAYHIAAGASYLKYGDFRINPEHPPLVKLWVGSVIAATGFHLDPLRRFSDKPDERVFTQRIVFRKNDPDSVQRRARAAMFVFNGLLLISLVFALERVFDAHVALGALLFLVIDPTVAAHAAIGNIHRFLRHGLSAIGSGRTLPLVRRFLDWTSPRSIPLPWCF